MVSVYEEAEILKQLGNSEEEIQKFISKETEALRLIGTPEEEIQRQTGTVTIDTTRNDPEVQEQNRSYWQKINDGIEGFKDLAIGDKFDFSLRRAMGKTLYNVGLQQAGKGIPYEEAFAVDDDQGFLESGLEGAVTLLGDLPAYAGSVIAATAATGNPVAGTGIGLAIPGAIRSIFLDQLDKQKVQNFSNFWDNWLIQALPESLRNDKNILGLLSGSKAIGKGIKEAGLLIATGASTKVLDATNIPKNFFTKTLTRTTAFTGLGAALESEMPTLDDFLTNLVIFKIAGFAESGSNMMRNRMKKTLKHPAEVIKEIFEDPVMFAEAASTTHRTFTKEKLIDNIKLKEAKAELEKLRNDKEFTTNPLVNKDKIKKYKEIKKTFQELGEPFKEIEITLVEPTATTAFKGNLSQIKKAIETTEKEISEFIKKNSEKNIEKLDKQLDSFADKQIFLEKSLETATTEKRKEQLQRSINKNREDFEAANKKFEQLKENPTNIEIIKDIDPVVNRLADKLENLKKQRDLKLQETEPTQTTTDPSFLNRRIEGLEKQIPEAIKSNQKKNIRKLEKNLKDIDANIVGLDRLETFATNIKDKTKFKNKLQEAKKERKEAEVELDNFKKDPFNLEINKKIDPAIKRLSETLENLKKERDQKIEQPKTVTELLPAEKNFDAKIKSGKIKKEVDAKFYNSALQNWSDKLHPIFEIARTGKKLDSKAMDFIYERFTIQPGMIGRAEHFIKFGTLDYTNLKDVGKPLLKILEPVLKSEKEYNAFIRYAIAKRVIEKEGQGKKTGFNLEDATAIVKKYDSVFNKPFKEFVEYNQTLFKYLLDSRLISKEFYKQAIELNKDYVPFARFMDMKSGEKQRATFFRNPIKEFKGSEKDVFDPIETSYLNTYSFVRLAEKNAVTRDFIDAVLKLQKVADKKVDNINKQIEPLNEKVNQIEKDIQDARQKGNNKKVDDLIKELDKTNLEIDGKIAEKNQALFNLGYEKIADIKKVSPDLRGFKLQKKEAEKIVDDPSVINEKLLEEFTIFRKQKQQIKDTEISFTRDGKVEVYEVGEMIAKAIKNDGKFIESMTMQILGIPTKVLKAGATLDPTFMIRNFIRGEVGASTFSKNRYVPFIHGAMGVARLIKGKNKQTQLYKDFIKSGAMQSALVSFDRQYIREGFMKQELTSRPVYNVVNPKNTLENLRILSEFTESAARIIEFQKSQKRLEKEPLTERQKLELAGLDARNVTLDFQKIGLKMQAVNHITAFYNARIRGYAQIIKGLATPKTAAKLISVLIATQTVPSVLLWFANRDSDTYENIDKWIKDTHHIIIVNEGLDDEIVYKVPKLWELGFIFGTLPERFLDYVAKEDPKSLDGIYEDIVKGLGKFVLNQIPLPEVLKLPVELVSNHSIYKNRPIVPRRLEGSLPEVQTTPYTSELAKLIGKASSQIPFTDGISPIKIDYAIKAWTGGLGAYALDATNLILKKAGIGDEFIQPWSDNYVKNLENMPFFRSFVARRLSRGATPLQKFWNEYSQIKKELDSSAEFKRRGDIARSLKVKSQRTIVLEEQVSLAAEQIKIFGDQIYRLERIPKDSVNISQNEIRDAIDNYIQAMINISKMTNKIIENYDIANPQK